MAMAAAASSERVLRSAAPATSATVPFDTMYINLDRRTDRRKSMESRLAAAGLSQWERVPARTGKETPPSRVCTEWDARLNHQFDTNCAARVYRFSDGERGCAMSHVLLWERVAARENEGRPVLVLEDDAVLDGRNSVAIISSLVALIERSAMPSQRTILLYLGAHVAAWRETGVRGMGAAGTRVREADWLWQTHAYVIWPMAAHRLLSACPVDMPVDNFISKNVLQRRIRALVTVPNLVEQEVPYMNGDVVHSSLEASYARKAPKKAPKKTAKKTGEKSDKKTDKKTDQKETC